MATYGDPFPISARQTTCSSENRGGQEMGTQAGERTRPSEHGCSSDGGVFWRELLRETWFERKNPSAYL